VGIDTSGYYFDPGIASLGAHWVLYEYVSDNQCSVRDSIQLMVNFAPMAAFNLAEQCVKVEGGEVDFENTSDTGTSQSVSWLWNFEYPSPLPEDRSTSKNPTHFYDTGSYTVSLNVIVGNCTDIAEKTIDIHANPEVEFTLSSNCQSDAPIIMTGQEKLYYPDSVIFWAWKIENADTEIFRSDTSGNILSYVFPSDTTYRITYSITTKAGCTDLIEEEISLNKTHFLSENSPYLEGFELEDHGWQAMALYPSQNSWTDNVVNPGEFPVDAASGTRAWFTDLPVPERAENSWVLSPCFNFNEFNRPMVSLDIKRSLNRNRDGAALQYTLDNGENWTTVGGVEDGGLKWYNSEDIVPNIGGKKIGWTGEIGQELTEDAQWNTAAYGLDELVGKQNVQFRIAFGLSVDSKTNDGFAFDNFNIRQRTRLSVLEYFTNANNSDCDESDTVIMKIMNEVPADVIDIQYHALGNLADEIYNDNPVPANNRGTVYGVTGIPYAILDGNFMTYDFTSNETPNVKDIRLRSLMDPDFKLTITVTQYTPTLQFSVEMKALKYLVPKERTLYAIVLQRRVADPEYVGTNGITVFRHVARKMLPDAGGTYLGSKVWSEGEIEYVNLSYESSFFPTIKDSITIAVFMQDDETDEILQAVTNPEYVVSTFDMLEPPSQVLIYPNPARELVNVYFEESPGEDMRFTLYDLSGKMVITDVIEPWQQHFTRTLGDLDQGLYILEIRSKDRRQVLYRNKLLHY
jgi:PKD repeat protein